MNPLDLYKNKITIEAVLFSLIVGLSIFLSLRLVLTTMTLEEARFNIVVLTTIALIVFCLIHTESSKNVFSYIVLITAFISEIIGFLLPNSVVFLAIALSLVFALMPISFYAFWFERLEKKVIS